MRRAVLACVVALAAAVPSAAQQQPTRDAGGVARTGSVTIAGVVTTDGADARPLRRALVSLAGTSGAMQTVTDDAGRFAFADLPAGRYTLTAEKPGYVKVFYGSRALARGPGTAITIADGQQVTTLTLRLPRGAVITGRVLDEQGVAIASAQVTPLMVSRAGGERRLVRPTGNAEWATTDDRGVFRLYGLTPGEYTVRATAQLPGGFGGLRAMTSADADAALRDLRPQPVTGRGAAAPPSSPADESRVIRGGTYFPATGEAALAESFELAAGEERSGVDIRLPLVRTARIEGIAVGPGGIPLPNIVVGIANASTNSIWSSPGIVNPGPDGRFSIPSLPPARYVLFGRGGEGATRSAPWPWWTETEVVISGPDVKDVVLQFSAGSIVSGRLMFAGAASPPPLTGSSVVLTPLPAIPGASSAPPRVTPSADGSFTVTDVVPGRYRLSVTGVAGWSLRSATVQGRDVLDVPIDVRAGEPVADLVATMTDKPTRIWGTLYDQIGRPTPEFAVIVFSTDRAHWGTSPRRSSGLVRLASDGTFNITGLPPGEYFLVAVTDAAPDQLNEPSFLELLSGGGLRVTLGDGESRQQDIKIGG